MNAELHGVNPYPELIQTLKIDCENCCGLCCIAFYCSKLDGFPSDKPSGTPCQNLEPDFRCRIHSELKKRKLRVCLAYDCMGAGQKVARELYGGSSWRESPELADEMLGVFLKVCELHKMLWHLAEAASLPLAAPCRTAIDGCIRECQRILSLSHKEIASLDLNEIQKEFHIGIESVLSLLFPGEKRRAKDLIGKNLKGRDLSHRDLSMTLLIAASLEGCDLTGSSLFGADLRDANLKGADLSEAVFLTQAQLNAAKGSLSTKLPPCLSYPASWSK